VECVEEEGRWEEGVISGAICVVTTPTFVWCCPLVLLSLSISVLLLFALFPLPFIAYPF